LLDGRVSSLPVLGAYGLAHQTSGGVVHHKTNPNRAPKANPYPDPQPVAAKGQTISTFLDEKLVFYRHKVDDTQSIVSTIYLGLHLLRGYLQGLAAIKLKAVSLPGQASLVCLHRTLQTHVPNIGSVYPKRR
jgi:hypothetical protein